MTISVTTMAIELAGPRDYQLIDANIGVIIRGGFGKMLALFTGVTHFVYSGERVIGDQAP